MLVQTFGNEVPPPSLIGAFWHVSANQFLSTTPGPQQHRCHHRGLLERPPHARRRHRVIWRRISIASSRVFALLSDEVSSSREAF